MRLQEAQQFFVQLVTVPVGVRYVAAPGVKDAEVAAKVPQRVADVVFGQDVEHVTKPAQEHVVRSVFVCSAFAAVNADAASRQLNPGLIVFL